MSKAHDRGRLDWLAELAGASAPAAAVAYAALKLAPLNGWAPSLALLAGFGGAFITAYLAMRCVPAEPRHLPLPDFEPASATDEVLLLDQRFDEPDELLLDEPWVATQISAATDAVAELLLDDPLPAPAPDSRVVQLFAGARMPTPGQLARRIDRHIAEGAGSGFAAPGDASDVLSEALAELRRTLRQA